VFDFLSQGSSGAAITVDNDGGVAMVADENGGLVVVDADVDDSTSSPTPTQPGFFA
jgi:hypothetical protein